MKTTIAPEIKQEILDKVKKRRKSTSTEKTVWCEWKNNLLLVTDESRGLLEFNKLKKENQQLKEIIGYITLDWRNQKKRKLSLELLGNIASPPSMWIKFTHSLYSQARCLIFSSSLAYETWSKTNFL